jgi:hypothetical protein
MTDLLGRFSEALPSGVRAQAGRRFDDAANFFRGLWPARLAAVPAPAGLLIMNRDWPGDELLHIWTTADAAEAAATVAAGGLM